MQARYHHHMPPSATVVTARHIFINFTFDSRKIAGARSKDENDQRSTLIIRINDLPQSSTSSFNVQHSTMQWRFSSLVTCCCKVNFSGIPNNTFYQLCQFLHFLPCVHAQDALKQEHHWHQPVSGLGPHLHSRLWDPLCSKTGKFVRIRCIKLQYLIKPKTPASFLKTFVIPKSQLILFILVLRWL